MSRLIDYTTVCHHSPAKSFPLPKIFVPLPALAVASGRRWRGGWVGPRSGGGCRWTLKLEDEGDHAEARMLGFELNGRSSSPLPQFTGSPLHCSPHYSSTYNPCLSGPRRLMRQAYLHSTTWTLGQLNRAAGMWYLFKFAHCSLAITSYVSISLCVLMRVPKPLVPGGRVAQANSAAYADGKYCAKTTCYRHRLGTKTRTPSSLPYIDFWGPLLTSGRSFNCVAN